ncbi:glutaredoxin-1 [Cyclospora cayetanensis]|uniref:Glutaredoxin-1 n=1 Tax=Cyclospora cayetanensis TaxID=88456 RepID=A0A6P6RQ77_9EIME|nr:glutaredoxin-1 [Cyclospora cayetanensis]
MELKSSRDVPQWAEELIRGHAITVFAKTPCPFCRIAIEALTSLNVSDMHVEEIDKSHYCDAIQDFLEEKTGARSVPRVFIAGKFFGGGDDTVAGVRSGAVQRLLGI